MNVPDKWTLLMTGDNNGLVGEFGCKFDGSPSHYELVDVQRIPAAPVAAPAPSEWTDAQVSAAGRALADRSAAECNVDKDDNWKVYGHDFIEDARLALTAARAAA